MKRSIARVMVLALVGATALAACGDDDGDSGDGGDGGNGGALSEQEYIEAGDELCASYDEAIEEAIADLESEFSDEDLTEEEATEAILEVAIPLIRDTIEQFGELEGPSDLTADVNEILDQIEEAVDEIEADPSSLDDEDDPFGDFDEQWSDLGFEECGSDD